MIPSPPIRAERAMNFSNLVERMVPLVAELFATLKVNDPLRMDFADIAHKTLYDIVDVLRSEGMTTEVIAESLGMTISGFYKKVKELRDLYDRPPDATTGRRGTQSLMEKVYAFVDQNSTPVRAVTYHRVSENFRRVPPERLNAVLRVLVQFNLLSVSGHGDRREFRTVPRDDSAGATYHDLVVTLYREGPLTLEELSRKLLMDEAQCKALLAELDANEGLETRVASDGKTRYKAVAYHIPVDTPEGFEAALWDHFSAMCRAMSKKVRQARYQAVSDETLGGTTYSFDVPVDSPEFAEIAGFLRDTRTQLERWLAAVQPYLHDREVARPVARITIYAGQMVEGPTKDEDAD